MSIAERFTRAVELLPDAVRQRLDGDAPLDWAALESAGLGVDVSLAAGAHRRLPEPVEALVHRLIRDVGIVPADVAHGVHVQGAAIAWLHWVTIEADSESYQIRNDRSGEVHTGVRPEAIAGYATLGSELASAIHDVCARWIEVSEQHREVSEGDRSNLAQCAARMCAQIRAQPEAISGRPTAASLARTLEYAWNSQSPSMRESLAGVRLSTTRGARAPGRNYYAPATSHHLHACDVGEMRWLRALAERAGAAAARPGASGREGSVGEPAAAAAGPVEAAVAEGPRVLDFGSGPEGSVTDVEVAALKRAASHLPGAIRKRLGDVHGTAIARALAWIQNPREVDAVRSGTGPGDEEQGAPWWLEDLATALLMDTGAQTREGSRTGSIRLDRERERGREGTYRGTEVETKAAGTLAPAGLAKQVRLSLTFVHDAWSGLTVLQSAGEEGRWTLREAEAGSRKLPSGERETLEAAQEIGQALERIHRSYTDTHGARPASALEQAALAAEALMTVGPTIRTAAGWPGGAEAPDARNPGDVARVAAVAGALHREIRAIANRLIAGWIAEAQAYGDGRHA